MIRESRKRGVNAVQEVNHSAEILIVPDILNVVLLGQVEVESHGRKLAFLTAFIDEGGRLEIGIASGLCAGAGATNTREQGSDGRVGIRKCQPGTGRDCIDRYGANPS